MPSLSESPEMTNFFKVMVPGFRTKLCLPPALCMKLRGEIPEEAFLTSCKGTWRVEIGRCSDGKTCFLAGWDDFVKNHDLKIGEFVFFEQTGHVHFDANVFGSTSCTKEFPVEVHEEEESSAPNTDEHAEIAKNSRIVRGRGRPRKRAAYVQQKGIPPEIRVAEATLGPSVDDHAASKAKRKCIDGSNRGRGRPRKRLASPEQRDSSVEILDENAPVGKNLYAHTMKKRGRGRPRKRTESLRQKDTVQYNMNHDIPSEDELSTEMNEEKEPYGNYVPEYTIQTRGRLSNGASSHWKQNQFVQKIRPSNIDYRGRCPGLYIPSSICRSYHISEKTSIALRGPSREWHEVNVKQHSGGRFCLRNGWRDFCRSNKVQLGDTCSFTIISQDKKVSSETITLEVKVSKSCI